MILAAINIEIYKAYRVVEGLDHDEFTKLGSLSADQAEQLTKILRTFLPEQNTTTPSTHPQEKPKH